MQARRVLVDFLPLLIDTSNTVRTGSINSHRFAGISLVDCSHSSSGPWIYVVRRRPYSFLRASSLKSSSKPISSKNLAKHSLATVCPQHVFLNRPVGVTNHLNTKPGQLSRFHGKSNADGQHMHKHLEVLAIHLKSLGAQPRRHLDFPGEDLQIAETRR